jgi:hypothetical protein
VPKLLGDRFDSDGLPGPCLIRSGDHQRSAGMAEIVKREAVERRRPLTPQACFRGKPLRTLAPTRAALRRAL